MCVARQPSEKQGCRHLVRNNQLVYSPVFVTAELQNRGQGSGILGRLMQLLIGMLQLTCSPQRFEENQDKSKCTWSVNLHIKNEGSEGCSRQIQACRAIMAVAYCTMLIVEALPGARLTVQITWMTCKVLETRDTHAHSPSIRQVSPYREGDLLQSQLLLCNLSETHTKN